MSNRGEVLELYYVSPTAGLGAGPLMKLTRVIFLSELDGKKRDMLLQELRVVRE